ELSRMAGMEYVIDSVFVDLYADGSYRGTYQLCERIQVQKTRLDIRDLEEDTEKLNEKALEEYPHIAVNANSVSEYRTDSYKYYDIPNDPEDITGGYLLQFQQANRYGYKAESGFVTSRGQGVQIDGPEIASQKQVLYIRKFMQELEDAIYSDTGYNSLGKHYSEYMDVDSLAAAYIIEEFSMNIDAGKTSFYMWKDSDLTGDGKLHFSPVWDYDLAYGTFAKSIKNSDGESGWSLNTNNLFAAYFPIDGYAPENTPESGLCTEGISWLGKMYKKDEYKKQVAKVWFERFVPALDELVKGDDPKLLETAESILPSAEMSNRRWHTYGGKQYCVFGDRSGKDFMESVDMLRVFAENRMNYLSGIWEPTTFICGDIDIDEKITAGDAAFLLQKALVSTFEMPVQKYTENWFEYSDVDCDGSITANDALTVMQKALAATFEMPAEKLKSN
ncbi:MAG: CotH kinase family protein, partial [Firmicutes bacterium]|nr:CotH kinase family protein [Bacillota bacterium]